MDCTLFGESGIFFLCVGQESEQQCGVQIGHRQWKSSSMGSRKKSRCLALLSVSSNHSAALC